MSQDVLMATLALLLVAAGVLPTSSAAADEAVLARLRRISRGEWVERSRPPTTVPYAREIRAASLRHELSPPLLAALVRAESAFNPRAVSWAGAQGLGQLMPSTALDMDVDDPFDPVENLDGAAHYLSLQLRRFGSVRQALAAYHAGPERVARRKLPYETLTYVARVLRFEREYRKLHLP
jgi:soluble lytic murein transglycosylase-like protein